MLEEKNAQQGMLKNNADIICFPLHFSGIFNICNDLYTYTLDRNV